MLFDPSGNTFSGCILLIYKRSEDEMNPDPYIDSDAVILFVLVVLNLVILFS